VDLDISLYIHNLNLLRGFNAEDGVRMAESFPISYYWTVPPPTTHIQVIVKAEHDKGEHRGSPQAEV
jgi:hypothetical protein